MSGAGLNGFDGKVAWRASEDLREGLQGDLSSPVGTAVVANPSSGSQPPTSTPASGPTTDSHGPEMAEG